MGTTILVADDETNITDVCARYLEREGFRVLTASDGEEAIALWQAHSPDLIVLDLMMPGRSGWQVCEAIRDRDEVPIVMLTARGEEMDRIMGLTLGADDYMTKPFSPRELVLRVKSILRRVEGRKGTENGAEAAQEVLRFPRLEIFPLQRAVRLDGRAIELTVKEFELLHLLARHPEQVFSRNQLLEQIWDTDYFGDTTTVTVHVRRLREKIEPAPSQPTFIKTVWGIGYKFEGREMR